MPVVEKGGGRSARTGLYTFENFHGKPKKKPLDAAVFARERVAEGWAAYATCP